MRDRRERTRSPSSGNSIDVVLHGAATLMVTPAGESFLIDTGFSDADRDAKRNFAAAQKAGLRRIDHVLISHFHGDHVGGLRALSTMIPIGTFYDHGDVVDEVDRGRLNDYKSIAGSNRVIVKPGDQIELKGGVKVVVVASVAADGTFTVTNTRNGFSKSYTARQGV